MFNADTELLFPGRVIPLLGEMRGSTWQKLVSRVSHSQPESADQIAFVLMMVRLNGCSSCNADSFRAMQGCTPCAKQSLRSYRGTDRDLRALFISARQEVIQYMQKDLRQPRASKPLRTKDLIQTP